MIIGRNVAERAKRRTPTGAEPDLIATNVSTSKRLAARRGREADTSSGPSPARLAGDAVGAVPA
jgi:hypothetical protein